MEFKLINELTESRLFRYVDSFDSHDIKDLAKIFYMMMLVLEIMRHEDKKWAADYVNKTLQYNEFTVIRSSASDMHNLIVALTEQDDFEFKTGPDPEISIPLFGLRRYMYDIKYKHVKKEQLDNNLFLDLESSLKIRDASLRSMRRMVINWKGEPEAHKKTLMRNLSYKLTLSATMSDISLHFKDVMHKIK